MNNNERTVHVTWCAVVAIAVCATMGASLYGCSITTAQYQANVSECLQVGGIVVPVGDQRLACLRK